MEKREYGTNPMAECRHDSHEKVDKKKRYRQITSILASYKVTGLTGLTAKEIAARMYAKGLIPSDERNYTAPRLTEMCEQGIVEPIGKRVCKWSGKKVTVYRLRGKA